MNDQDVLYMYILGQEFSNIDFIGEVFDEDNELPAWGEQKTSALVGQVEDLTGA